MGCCNSSETDLATSDPGSSTAGADTAEDVAGIFDRRVELEKREGHPFPWGFDESTLVVTYTGEGTTKMSSAGKGKEFTSVACAVFVGWTITSVTIGKETAKETAKMCELIRSDAMQNTKKVFLQLNRRGDQLQSFKVSRLAHQDLGLVFWQDSMVILQVSTPFGVSLGLREFEGWRVVGVDETLIASPAQFAQCVKDRASFTLRIADEKNMPSALRKIKRQLLRFIARSKLDTIMFLLILRNLEIQEENEINSTKDEFELAPHETSCNDTAHSREISMAQLQQIKDNLLNFGKIPEDKESVHAIVYMAKNHFAKQRNVKRIKAPETGKITVVGDLHGQLSDLLYILETQGMPSPNHHILFNGDYVDRGESGVEVLLILLVLSLLHPDCVHLNRGNHEDRRINAKYGFGEECAVLKYDLTVYNAVQSLFESLPLVHIAKKVAVMHGGLPEFEGLTIEEIDSVDRFRSVPPTSSSARREDKIMQGLLWSDPKEDLRRDFEKSKRGAGVFFSKKLTDAFLKANELEHIVRSHQTVDQGVKVHHGGRVRTVFSAANYRGKEDNKAAVMVLEWRDKSFAGASFATWTAADKHSLMRKFEPGVLTREVQTFEDTKEDVLRRVRMLIFRRQVQLLKAFQEADLAEEGTVTPSQWVQVMRSVLENIPWSFLSRHLVQQEQNGMIAYTSFLNRFQSRLLTRWVRNWCDAVMPYIILKIGNCIGDIEDHFRQIDTDKTQSLSYHELYLFLTRRQHLIALDSRLIVFVLQYLDKNGDGFISLQEFREAFQDSYNRIKGTPEDNELMRIWESRSANPVKYAEFEQAFRNEEQRVPGSKGVPLSVFVDVGRRCLGGDAAKWRRTGDRVATNGVVRFKHLQRAVKRLTTLCEQSQSVSGILRRLSDSAVSLQSYYLAMDQTGRGMITKKQFCKGLSRFGITNTAWRPLWSLIDTNRDGYLSLEEFLRAFEVVDVAVDDVSLGESATPKAGRGGQNLRYDINSDYSSAYDFSGESDADESSSRRERKKKSRRKKRAASSEDDRREKKSKKSSSKKKSKKKSKRYDEDEEADDGLSDTSHERRAKKERKRAKKEKKRSRSRDA